MGLEKVAIIDIGSNSMRLEILARRGSDYWLVEKQKETARISSGMYNETSITRESLDRAKAALSRFSSLIAFHRVDHIRCVATSAVRDARNQPEVLEELESVLPYKIEVLSGEEEAFYSYFGVKNSLDLNDGVVFDVGGGSTECISVQKGQMETACTLPLGAVRLTELFFRKNGSPNTREWKKLEKHIDRTLSEAPSSLLSSVPRLVGVGGTVRQLARISQRMTKYPLYPIVHEYEMSKKEIEKVMSAVREMSLTQRNEVLGIPRDRADILPAGILLISRIMDLFRNDSLTVSQQGLRYGLFMEYYRGSRSTPPESPANLTLRRMSRKYGRYRDSRNQRRLAMIIGRAIFPDIFSSPLERTLLTAVNTLSATSLYYHPVTDSSSIGPLFLEEDLQGFTHPQRVMVALSLIRSRNPPEQDFRKNMKPFADMLSPDQSNRVILYSRLTSLAREALLFAGGRMPHVSYAEPFLMITDPGEGSDSHEHASTLLQTTEKDMGKGRNIVVQWMRYGKKPGETPSG
uniref:Ppx/GppA family phosphatase n=1 Tax=Leptospirillum ferriphilum TaxID=178606 RepID=A0A7C3QU08_9BACT